MVELVKKNPYIGEKVIVINFERSFGQFRRINSVIFF